MCGVVVFIIWSLAFGRVIVNSVEKNFIIYIYIYVEKIYLFIHRLTCTVSFLGR